MIATKGGNLKLCALIKMNCFISPLTLSGSPASNKIYEPPPPTDQTTDIFVFNQNLFFNFVLLLLRLRLFTHNFSVLFVVRDFIFRLQNCLVYFRFNGSLVWYDFAHLNELNKFDCVCSTRNTMPPKKHTRKRYHYL